MGEPAAPGALGVTVAWSPAAREVKQCRLELPVGATVADALRACGADAALAIGIWGRKVSLDHVLRDGDRVELYRELRVDPKVARRERFQRQGARAAGLFSRRKS